MSIIKSDPLLTVEKLSYTYSDGRVALRDISFTLEKGERLGIVGPNGAGKSTLLLHLNGSILCPPDTYSIRGVVVGKRNRNLARETVGLMFQQPDDMLFNLTVCDDVAFGPRRQVISREELKDRVQGAIHAVGLEGFEERPPFHLSLGEKKRAALATLLAMRPEVLALDEPFNSLDPAGKREMIALLAKLPQAMIVVSHDLEAVLHLCGRVLILNNGNIIADGPPYSLFADTTLLESCRLV